LGIIDCFQQNKKISISIYGGSERILTDFYPGEYSFTRTEGVLVDVGPASEVLYIGWDGTEYLTGKL